MSDTIDFAALVRSKMVLCDEHRVGYHDGCPYCKTELLERDLLLAKDHAATLQRQNAILREANQRLCEGAEAENQRALKAEVARDIFREALVRIKDHIQGLHQIGLHTQSYAWQLADEALNTAGGGE